MKYTYRATLLDVVDGDTIKVQVDLGFNLSRKIKLRLKDIDTPELYRPSCEAEKIHAQEAKKFLYDYLMGTAYSGELIIKTYRDPDIYDRYTAIIWRYLGDWDVRNNVDASTFLKEHGFEKKEMY